MNDQQIIPGIELKNEIELTFCGSTDQIETDLIALYTSMNIQYPKFYKMNLLCKLGFLGVEQLIKDHQWLEAISKEKIATVFINRSSSISSDSIHAASIAYPEQLASPAVFVYTLPNILNGELAIRHGWTGYNAFFIENSFESIYLEELIALSMASQPSDVFVTGWVETDLAQNRCSCILRLYQTSDE